MTGEGHLAYRGQQTTVGTVMVGQQQAVTVQVLHGIEEVLQGIGVLDIGTVMADLPIDLRAVGQPVLVPQAPTEGMVRLYDSGDVFLGVGEILDDGRVQPKRLV